MGTQRRITVTTAVGDETLVKLDFGEYGTVEVPPEVASSFISDQHVRDSIRTQCTLAVRARRRIAAEQERQERN